MGIRIHSKTNKKATVKLLNALSSYLFEELYGELRRATPKQVSSLKEAAETLKQIAYESNI